MKLNCPEGNWEERREAEVEIFEGLSSRMKRLAPSERKVCAIESPIPEPPPVRNTVLLCSRFAIVD